ncbi:HSP20-like chaperone [Mycena pura]|uniref:HSP20-like chaperone n=1 Tax=Mycena pura TaxID=153505 RepID=A0AAD6VGI8_9AGAR|nr:HSP20-like chaperone [Mycena pura]
MSIARQLLHDFRPFFRMLDEPLRSAAFARSRSLLDDTYPWFPVGREMLRGPTVDISEAGNTYIVEAELPGVKKENLQVRIGDGGRSLTIEGKLLTGTESTESAPVSEGNGDKARAISTERSAFGSFSRTVFLPRAVDSNAVAAKLQDGILQLTLNKAEDKASVVVNVE